MLNSENEHFSGTVMRFKAPLIFSSFKILVHPKSSNILIPLVLLTAIRKVSVFLPNTSETSAVESRI